MIKIGTRKEYHKQMNGKERLGKEDCPFEKYDGKIIWKGKNWFIVHNLFPYSGTEKHIMTIPIRHVKYSVELNDDELLEMKDVYKVIKDFFGEDNYFSCTRESMANRSIEHLHIHFIPGKLQGKYLRKMLENQGFPIVEDMDYDINI